MIGINPSLLAFPFNIEIESVVGINISSSIKMSTNARLSENMSTRRNMSTTCQQLGILQTFKREKYFNEEGLNA